ncbi:uncharacterized protein LOC119450658 isoform X2 [Dermacentor silvarum]|uniref:uncharacterized protein LOC119450658 isoform X2 n=1 Tax=Dermacentor silvarum TaxID=543639 RepID=UPI0021012923|nr:uncharacterized protein LOC119450658 isoform X2 [Dermacentor silvarum]XP_049522077.1 uncharacterized protein LOC119450658 isoform X2 [Dermacentor silvarum]
MTSLKKTFHQYLKKRGRCLKLSAYTASLGSGLLVAVLGYCLRERLEVLGIVERQDWELEGRRQYLVGLAATTVVLGFICTLAAVLGIGNLLLDLSAHITLDIIFGVLALAEVGVALASFLLRTWVNSDIAPERADCEEDLRNAVIVTGRLLPMIGFLFLASAVSQSLCIAINRVESSRAGNHANHEGTGNPEKEEMNTMNQITAAMSKSNSGNGNVNCSNLLSGQPQSEGNGVYIVSSTTRMDSLSVTTKTSFEMASTEVTRDAFSEVTTAAPFRQQSSGGEPRLERPEFSGYYDNEEECSPRFNVLPAFATVPSAPSVL